MQPINTDIKRDNESSGHEEFGHGTTTGEVLASTPQIRSIEEHFILSSINDIEEQARIPKANESEEILFGAACLTSAHTAVAPAVYA